MWSRAGLAVPGHRRGRRAGIDPFSAGVTRGRGCALRGIVVGEVVLLGVGDVLVLLEDVGGLGVVGQLGGNATGIRVVEGFELVGVLRVAAGHHHSRTGIAGAGLWGWCLWDRSCGGGHRQPPTGGVGR